MDLSTDEANEFRARLTYRRLMVERERVADALFVARTAQRVLVERNDWQSLADAVVERYK